MQRGRTGIHARDPVCAKLNASIHMHRFILLHLARIACCCLALAGTSVPASAEVIPVASNPASNPASSGAQDFTQTMFWKSANSLAVLILIPGGDAHLGLRADQTDLRHQFYQTLKSLTNPQLSAGNIDVVIFDSPTSLDLNSKGYPASRGTDDHMVRIDSVVRYYREKLNKPVFLMGHSNGAVSVTEYLRYVERNDKPRLLRGLIYSSARSLAYFKPPIDLPVQFIHHGNDGCPSSLLSAAQSNFENVKGWNKSETVFTVVTSGEAEGGSPCSSGFHMYNKAGQEVVRIIENFVGRNAN